MSCIDSLFLNFKNIEYENILYKTWYQSIKNLNINNFNVYTKKIKNTSNYNSIILGFYCEDNAEITIKIGQNEIKQKIPPKELTYPICNIILTKAGCYTEIDINTSISNLYGVFITLSLKDIDNMYRYKYFSNFIYEGSKFHLCYSDCNIYLNDNFYEKNSNEIEIPSYMNRKTIWKNILENNPDFNYISKFNDILIKLSLEINIWNKIKDNTVECKKVEKIINEYRKIFDVYNLYDSVISKFII